MADRPSRATRLEQLPMLLMEALEAHQSGRYDDAKAGYEGILEEFPFEPNAQHLLGVLHYQLGELDRAEALIRAAVERVPEAASYWSNLGNVLRAKGRTEDAIDAYARAHALDESDADAANNLAKVYIETDRLDEAAALLEQVCGRAPRHAEARNNLGLVHKRRGELDTAIGLFREALALEPRYFDAQVNLGNTLSGLGAVEHARGNLERSLVWFDECLEYAPNDVAAQFERSIVLFELDRLDEAEAAAAGAVALKPDYADAHCNLGVIFRSQRRPSDAIRALCKAVELDPAHAEAHVNLGRIYSEQDRHELAEQHFRRVLALEQTGTVHGVAVRQLANALRRAGRTEEAVALLREWSEREPENAVARHLLAAFTGEDVPPRASDGYVRELFDHFASSFDAVLASLHYRAPKLVAERFERFARERGGDLEVLDAACGTGLMGELLRASVSRLVGVDLSAGMLARARNRGIYDELLEAELTEYFSRSPSRFDAVTCVDSFVYFGDLQEVVRASRRVLKPGGLLCFTLERCQVTDGAEDYALQAHGRYRHRSSYVERLLEEAGYVDVRVENVIARMEGAEPVASLLVSARAAGTGSASGRRETV